MQYIVHADEFIETGDEDEERAKTLTLVGRGREHYNELRQYLASGRTLRF